MVNKGVLARFIYKPSDPTEKLFTYKNFEIYYSMHIEERRWICTKILLVNC